MRTIKRAGNVIKTQEFQPKNKEKFILSLIQMHKGNGYIRKGNFSSEIVWDGKSYMFPPKTKTNSFKIGLFLFGMVRKDAKDFVKSCRKLKFNKKFPVNDYNEDFNDLEAKITGTDLNHAYWRIAYNLGIISEKTYQKGLHDDFKVTRLSALSTLGKGKDYYVIKNGKITDEVIKIGMNEDLDYLYRAIRQTCYSYMQKLKKILKDDFICYRTDCIYYVDKPENRDKVKSFLKEKDMSFKQLYKIKKTLHE
jgi:hypothetical protein